MKKDHLAFLLAGLAFGFLLGFGFFRALASRPGNEGASRGAETIPQPAGPAAPMTTPMGGAPQAAGGGAPMMAEINALKERVQKDPKDAGAWVRLANLYQDSGMFEPAIEFYQRALAIVPDDANVLTDMGICYQEIQRFDEALAALRRAQASHPEHWQSLYNIVVVAGLRTGRFEEADAAMKRLQEINPDAPQLAELRGALANARRGAAPATP